MKKVSGWIWLVCSGAVVLAFVPAAHATRFSHRPIVLNPVCVSGPSVGQPCVLDADCDGGVCEGTEILFECAGGANAGAPCQSREDCDSDVCGPDSAHQVAHVTRCNGGPNAGELCDSHADCESAPGAWDYFCIGDYEIWLRADDMIITEVYVSEWSPNDDIDNEGARLWQFDIDEFSFTNDDCPDGGVFPYHWDRAPLPPSCATGPCPPEWPVCDPLNICVGPNHHPEDGFFIDASNPDYIFYLVSEFPAVDYVMLRAGSTNLSAVYPLYTPPPNYLATMAFVVSDNTCGDYTIPMDLAANTTAIMNPWMVPDLPTVAEDLVVHTVPAPPCVVWTDPDKCIIDPGQPREPDDATKQGWTSMDFGFRATDELATVTAIQFEASRVPENPAVPPWGIDHIEVNNIDKVVTVVFDNPATPGRWNCIEWRPRDQKFCFGYLPGDFTNDRATALNDITRLIDHLTGVTPLPPEQYFRCDINRSGACTGADLLRVIDVLNGGSPYTRWLDHAGLLDCPSLNVAYCEPAAAKRARGIR